MRGTDARPPHNEVALVVPPIPACLHGASLSTLYCPLLAVQSQDARPLVAIYPRFPSLKIMKYPQQKTWQ